VLTQLRAHLAANPGHKVVLVLASDGLPGGCPLSTIPAVADDLRAALMASPSIPTYVIGVFAMSELNLARPMMERLATSGGTGQPFVVTAANDLTQKLQAALEQIRGAALPCEFTIPAPKMGSIDFGKVNVRYTTSAGADNLLYVETPERCDATRGGWYYDVPPARGMPTRVLVCPATCQRFKGDPTAAVDLLFGCATRVIP
jgi:hypothetical protein